MRTSILMLIAAAGTIAVTGCTNWDNERDDGRDYREYETTQPRGTTSTTYTDQDRQQMDTRRTTTRSDTVWHSSRDTGVQGETGRTTMQQDTQRTPTNVQGAGQQLRQADQDFIKFANTGNLKEVEFGRLAQRQGSSDRVRQYGQKLIDDHTKANDELTDFARTKNVQLATQLPTEHKQMVDRMNQMQGEEFDREFVQHMIKDHEKLIQEFDQQARTSEDPQLKAHAQRQLPILRSHLQMARDIQTSLEATDLGTPRRDPNQPTRPFDPNDPYRNPTDPNFPTQPTEPRPDPTMPR